MAADQLNIIISGVGGQGVILTSKIIAQAGLMEGWQVRTSETIGMAQREGSVNSHVRIGHELFSPQICERQADILISMELAETVRGLKWLRPDGIILVNDHCVLPSTVVSGTSVYPKDEIRDYLSSSGREVYFLPAGELAVKAGNIKCMNVVMLGAASALLEKLKKTCEGVQDSRTTNIILNMDKALEYIFPQRLLTVNKQAFAAGKAALDI